MIIRHSVGYFHLYKGNKLKYVFYDFHLFWLSTYYYFFRIFYMIIRYSVGYFRL